jgi:hypothetical protein
MDASRTRYLRKVSHTGQRGAWATCNAPVDACSNGVARVFWRIVMKTFVSALIALSVLAGVAAPASALDPKTFYDQQDRQSH